MFDLSLCATVTRTAFDGTIYHRVITDATNIFFGLRPILVRSDAVAEQQSRKPARSFRSENMRSLLENECGMS